LNPFEKVNPHPPAPTAGIFDVDGVLLASPHERAWREALQGFADPACFTTAIYQAKVAGKPRLAGARAALEALGVPDWTERAADYSGAKQTRLEALILAGTISAFPDALRLVGALAVRGWPMAVASSSKNANAMMRQIRLPSGQNLLDVFTVNLCGRDLKRGKPDPEIFLLAADALQAPPVCCMVFEDSSAGIEAARAGGMRSVGVARLGDAAQLRAAGADRVVMNLDEIDVEELLASEAVRRPP
jgi:HAD superfamily hydrolase (TIGR01509 family)